MLTSEVAQRQSTAGAQADDLLKTDFGLILALALLERHPQARVCVRICRPEVHRFLPAAAAPGGSGLPCAASKRPLVTVYASSLEQLVNADRCLRKNKLSALHHVYMYPSLMTRAASAQGQQSNRPYDLGLDSSTSCEVHTGPSDDLPRLCLRASVDMRSCVVRPASTRAHLVVHDSLVVVPRLSEKIPQAPPGWGVVGIDLQSLAVTILRLQAAELPLSSPQVPQIVVHVHLQPGSHAGVRRQHAQKHDYMQCRVMWQHRRGQCGCLCAELSGSCGEPGCS